MSRRLACAAVAAVVALMLGSSLVMPTPATAGTLHRRYTYSFPVAHCRVSYGRYHHDYPATDIFADKGCRFVAPIAGTVDEVHRHDTWNPRTDRGATRPGRWVSIIGIDGVRYFGCHLSGIGNKIRPGVHVKAGQLVGFVGKSGNARNIGDQLHFGISWPTRHGAWWIVRGEVWPYRFLNAWRHHRHPHLSPVRAVRRALQRAGRRVPKCSVDC